MSLEIISEEVFSPDFVLKPEEIFRDHPLPWRAHQKCAYKFIDANGFDVCIVNQNAVTEDFRIPLLFLELVNQYDR